MPSSNFNVRKKVINKSSLPIFRNNQLVFFIIEFVEKSNFENFQASEFTKYKTFLADIKNFLIKSN